MSANVKPKRTAAASCGFLAIARLCCIYASAISAKLHYTDTGYGRVVQHHQRRIQRTSLQQFYNLLYNKFTTSGQKNTTSQHLDMSRCWALELRCGKFVVQQLVELLWARPLVMLYNMSVAGIRVVEFGANYRTLRLIDTCAAIPTQ